MTKLLPLVALLTGCATIATPAPQAPLVDYHQHLVSPAFAPIATFPQRDGRALVAELDAAGIRKAVVLSVAYSFADERKKQPDPDRLSREENDWTSREVAASNGRLIGFCSANPLRDAALAELERCLRLPGMVGIKQHFGNAGVTLRNAEHLDRMKQIFALAQRLRVPILVHMRYRGGTSYAPEDATTFIDQLLPLVPGTDVIVAHLAGSGPGYPSQNDAIMAVFGDAAERRDPRLRRVYFDVTTNVTVDATPADAAAVAKRIRQIGVKRTLYGSDLSPPGGSIRSGWNIFQSKVPLSDAEFRSIARNRLPFTR